MKRIVIIIDDEVETPAFTPFRNAIARGDFSRYTFIWCVSCEDALEEIGNNIPYALLLDLNFPPGDMQGIELIVKIRERDSFKSIPILVLTSVDSLTSAVDTMRIGASDYIPKPKGAVSLSATEIDLLASKLEQLDTIHYRPYSQRIAYWYNVNAAQRHDGYVCNINCEGKRKRTIPKREIEAGLIDTRKRVFDSHLVSGSRQYNPALVASIPELLINNIGWQQELPSRLTTLDGRDFEVRDDLLKTLPIVLFHGLGASTDSIALIADLGRAFRLSTLWGSKRRLIMLAGPRWGTFNFANKQYINDSHILLETLRKQQIFRSKLYSATGFETNIFDFPGGSDATAVTIDINKLLSEVDIALEIASQYGFDRTTLSGMNREDFLQRIRPTISKLDSSKKLREQLAAKLLMASWDIKGQWEKNTMLYFLAQETATLGIGTKFIKIAVDSEQSFDQAISKRATGPGRKNIGSRLAFYFQHYELSGKKILPFNSLSLDFVQNEDSYLRESIHLENSSEMVPISVLLKSSISARTRLLSDCLCFLHLLSILHRKLHENEIRLLFESVRLIDDELWASFAYYVQQENKKSSEVQSYDSVRERILAWVEGIDAYGFVHLPLPYYIVPYVWYEDEWEQKAVNILNFLRQLASLTIQIVNAQPDNGIGSASLGFKMHAHIQASNFRSLFSEFSLNVEKQKCNSIWRNTL